MIPIEKREFGGSSIILRSCPQFALFLGFRGKMARRAEMKEVGEIVRVGSAPLVWPCAGCKSSSASLMPALYTLLMESATDCRTED